MKHLLRCPHNAVIIAKFVQKRSQREIGSAETGVVQITPKSLFAEAWNGVNLIKFKEAALGKSTNYPGGLSEQPAQCPDSCGLFSCGPR